MLITNYYQHKLKLADGFILTARHKYNHVCYIQSVIQ